MGPFVLRLCFLFLGAVSQVVVGTDQVVLEQQPLHETVVGNATRSGQCPDDLVVKTSLFTVQGAVTPETDHVRQFLGIPFAEAPVGKLRFRPPMTKKATNEIIDATKYGPYCYQHNPVASIYFSENLAGFQVLEDQAQSEDCLTLDIWAPRHSCSEEPPDTHHVGKAAVMIWIHGGALMNGDSSAPYTRGTRIVQKHEDIIVVSINYRVNIFGFPRAEALDGHNLNPAFLDIRKGVEWVYNNIHHFGGNPNQMIIFGDSAGSSSVDKYIYAWAHDPLVQGYIMQSGQGEISGDPNDHSNFTFVAEKVGCGGDKDEMFKCMQSVNADDIIEVLNNYDSTLHGGKSLNFQPQADNETSFSNYTDLQVRGIYSHLPQVIGNCDNEFASLYQPLTEEAPDKAVLDALSDGMFICPAAKAARARQNNQTPIWRYRYFGEFPNQNFLPWLHAYHGSDVPMVFGTTDTYGPNTPEQTVLSVYIQSAFVAFTKDPEHALTEQFGWPLYRDEEEALVCLGKADGPEATFVKGSMYDGACSQITAPLQYN